MPNWCANNAEFYNEDTAKVDELEARLKNLTDEDGLFSFFVKIPAEEKENWYSWNTANWGTKWEASVYSHERTDDNTIRVNFDTAWCPPIAMYEYLSQNTDWYTEATYYESGMAFIGKVSGEWDDCYNIDGIASLDNIPEELLEEYNVREQMEELEEEIEFESQDNDEDAESPEWKTPEWDTPQENAFADEVGRDWLKTLLQERVVGVTFTKKDGTKRVMNCTLSENLIPKAPIHATNTNNPIDFSKTKKINTEVQPVFDIEAQSWRSFRWDSIKQINFALGEENV